MNDGSQHVETEMIFGCLIAAMVCGCATHPDAREPSVAAEVRAIEFLKREVPAWFKENRCFSCHNNGDAARALYTAARKGYRIPRGVLADTTAWVVRPAQWEHNKGDPGFSDKRLANIQFAASLLAAFEAGYVKDRQPVQEAAKKLATDQGNDGAWHIEPGNAVGSPATYGTTLATFAALTTLRKAGAPEASEAIRKAEDWLRHARSENVPAAATLLLFSASDSGESSLPTRSSALNLIRRAQGQDGGWGPYPDSPPEPFDTALVLLALAELSRTPDLREMIQRGRHFLTAQQNVDGSWPPTTRPPGGDSYAQRLSTTGWATLALLATQR